MKNTKSPASEAVAQIKSEIGIQLAGGAKTTAQLVEKLGIPEKILNAFLSEGHDSGAITSTITWK